MSKIVALRGFVCAAPFFVLASAASAVVVTDNAVATQADLLTGFVALDLSGIIPGLTVANSLTSNFTAPGSAYTGSLTASVYGNVANPGASLDTVLMIYEFTGNGPSGIDQFAFGIDSGTNLDFNDLLNSTQGSIGDSTSAGQGSPTVDLVDNSSSSSNDTLTFGFIAGGDTLGANGQTETFGWYILSSADIAINMVDVEVTDFGAVVTQSLGIVNNPGQPNLNVPAPGSVTLILGAFGLINRRRRT